MAAMLDSVVGTKLRRVQLVWVEVDDSSVQKAEELVTGLVRL